MSETPDSEPDVSERPAVRVQATHKRPISPDWQKDCRRFGAWLAGASFVAILAWLTGANALVPLSNGKIIHADYVGWPLILMLIGVAIGIYAYLAAPHGELWIPGRRYAEIDHSYRYSLLFVSPALRFEFYDDEKSLGVQVGVRFSNGFTKPIQVYLERLEVTVNGVDADSYDGKVRRLRIMPNQAREFRAPTVRDFPQGYFNGEVSYSVLYGPLDASAIYRRTHKFLCQVTGAKVTAAELRERGAGANDWTDIDSEDDVDMPEFSSYPD